MRSLYSISEPFFCPFCHDVLGHRMADDFNHFIQCLVAHARWWTLLFRDTRRIV
jgi:hypothetical protein